MTRKRILLFFCFSLILFALLGFNPPDAEAQPAPLTDPQPLASTGVLTGTITEAASGLPLTNIKVCAVGNSDGSYRCTQTGADGVYTFTDLPTGNYSVGVDQDGWAVEYYDGAVSKSSANHIQVINGQATTGIDIALDPGGTLNGVVTNTTGNPLAGAQVRLLIGEKDFFTCTDSSGNYEISDISYDQSDYGHVSTRVDPACSNILPNYAVEYWQDQPSLPGTVIRFTRENPVVGDIDFTLELGGSISGTVTSDDSSGLLNNIPVCAKFGVDEICAQTASDGTYTIPGLPTLNEYVVRVLADGWALEYYNDADTTQNITQVAVTAGQDTSGIDFALEPGGIISGTVTDPDGQPVEDANVTLSLGLGAKTDANGQYQNASIPFDEYFTAYARSYDLRGYLMYATEYWQDNPWHGVSLQLTSETPELSGIDFTLESLGAITGTVSAWSGETLADHRVCRHATYDNWNYLDHCAYTDSYGRYRLIVPHDYLYVYVVDRASNYVYYDDPEIPGDRDQVSVDNGEVVSGIDLITDPCFQASDGTQLNEVALNWCIAPETDIFEVYRTPPEGNAELIGTTTGITFSDVTAVPGVHYSYQVKACIGGVCSDFSAPDSGWINDVAGPGEHDDSFHLIGYESDWAVLSGEPYSNGSLHESYTRGNFAILAFQGSCVSVHYVTNEIAHGIMDIYIDDVFIDDYDQYSLDAPSLMQTDLVCVEYGIHTLKVLHRMGNPVTIDGIDIVDYRYKYFAPLLP